MKILGYSEELFSLLLSPQGLLYGCGSNRHGQMATDPSVHEYYTRFTPILIGYQNDVLLKSASTAGKYIVAVDTVGNLWHWGEGSDNGYFPEIKEITGTTNDIDDVDNKDLGKLPYYIPRLLSRDHEFTKVSCSYTFTSALDSFGNVWLWDSPVFISDYNGSDIPERYIWRFTGLKLHTPDGTEYERPEAPDNLLPTMIEGLKDIIDISSRVDSSFYLDRFGIVFLLGKFDDTVYQVPHKLDLPFLVKRISSAEDYTCFHSVDGGLFLQTRNIYCFGTGYDWTDFTYIREQMRKVELPFPDECLSEIICSYGMFIVTNYQDCWLYYVSRKQVHKSKPQFGGFCKGGRFCSVSFASLVCYDSTGNLFGYGTSSHSRLGIDNDDVCFSHHEPILNIKFELDLSIIPVSASMKRANGY